MLWKCCTQYASKFGKLSSPEWKLRTGKGQFSFQSQRKAMPKNAQTTAQLRSSHRLGRECSKSFKLSSTSMWTENFQMFRWILNQRSNCNFCWIIEKESSRKKTSTSALLTMPKPLTVWITTNCGKFWKRWEYQIIWPASWEICMLIRKQQLELDMEQQTGSKLGKEYIKAVYCYLAYLTSMQSTSWEILGWMKHKLESRLPGEISITSDMQMTSSFWQKQRKTKEPLNESERGEWKSWLKIQHSKN